MHPAGAQFASAKQASGLGLSSSTDGHGVCCCVRNAAASAPKPAGECCTGCCMIRVGQQVAAICSNMLLPSGQRSSLLFIFRPAKAASNVAPCSLAPEAAAEGGGRGSTTAKPSRDSCVAPEPASWPRAGAPAVPYALVKSALSRALFAAATACRSSCVRAEAKRAEPVLPPLAPPLLPDALASSTFCNLVSMLSNMRSAESISSTSLSVGSPAALPRVLFSAGGAVAPAARCLSRPNKRTEMIAM
eukprot:365763-Chlamydomonas_euryale.AAC.18